MQIVGTHLFHRVKGSNNGLIGVVATSIQCYVGGVEREEREGEGMYWE